MIKMNQMNIYLKKKNNNNTIIYYNMTNQNYIYGGVAGVIGTGVLYFLYSKFKKDNSRQSSVDSDKGANDDYEAWTGKLAPTMNWAGGKSKKNKKSKNKKSKKNK